jgi:uncharacterized protein YgbK (DUF1537 family)
VTADIAVAGPPEVPVLVIDTETRHLTGEDARAVVRDCVQSALRFVPWLVYKKTYSTLRGNIAAEFRVLVELNAALVPRLRTLLPGDGPVVSSDSTGSPCCLVAF